MSIREEMMSGRLYDASSGELLAELYRAQELCQEYNALRITDFEGRAALLDKLLPHKGSGLTIVPPFFCDYGSNLEFGDNVFINGYCVFLDEARITIGSNVFCLGQALRRVILFGNVSAIDAHAFEANDQSGGYMTGLVTILGIPGTEAERFALEAGMIFISLE